MTCLLEVGPRYWDFRLKVRKLLRTGQGFDQLRGLSRQGNDQDGDNQQQEEDLTDHDQQHGQSSGQQPVEAFDQGRGDVGQH